MRAELIFRTLGAAAVIGGVLRMVDSFTGSVLDMETLDRMYFATDVFLMLGLGGWYFSRAQRLGSPGLAGFVACVLGLMIIRSPQVFAPRGYILGSAMVLAGLTVMNLLTVLRRDGPIAAPVLWNVALVFGVLALMSGPVAPVAGVIFSLGYILAGIELWRHPVPA
jgi:hypothetical protein